MAAEGPNERDHALFTVLCHAYVDGKGWDMEEGLSDEQGREMVRAVKAIMLAHAEAVEAAHPEAVDEDRIAVASGFGALTQRPFVDMTIEGRTTQFRPEKARELGAMLFDSASVAEMDAMFVRWAQEKLGLDSAQAASVLQHELRPFADESRLRDLADHNPTEQPLLARMAVTRSEGITQMNRKARRAAARRKGGQG